jgi:hypothetical protein
VSGDDFATAIHQRVDGPHLIDVAVDPLARPSIVKFDEAESTPAQ